LSILTYQRHTHSAGHEDEDRVRLERTDACQFGSEVEIAKRNIDLVEHFAMEVMFEARSGITPSLEVGHQRHDALISRLLCVLAHRLWHLVVLPGGGEKKWAALFASKDRGSGVDADKEGPALGDRLEDRLQNVGRDHADDEVDLVAFEKLPGSSE